MPLNLFLTSMMLGRRKIIKEARDNFYKLDNKQLARVTEATCVDYAPLQFVAFSLNSIVDEGLISKLFEHSRDFLNNFAISMIFPQGYCIERTSTWLPEKDY